MIKASGDVKRSASPVRAGGALDAGVLKGELEEVTSRLEKLERSQEEMMELLRAIHDRGVLDL